MVSSACVRSDGTQVGVEGRVGRMCWFVIALFVLGIITNLFYVGSTIPKLKRKNSMNILIVSIINIITPAPSSGSSSSWTTPWWAGTSPSSNNSNRKDPETEVLLFCEYWVTLLFHARQRSHKVVKNVSLNTIFKKDVKKGFI